MERNEAISRIKAGLQRRSGKVWSVAGGRGTAWGWITIDAPPARRTSRYLVRAGCSGNSPDDYDKTRTDTASPGGYITEAEAAELAQLLGWPDGEAKNVHSQGVRVPASSDYWEEYADRAEGRRPKKLGVQYWD